MTLLNQFLPRLLVYVPACSDPLAMQALLDSAIEFCEKTGVISARLDPIYLTPNTTEYELESPLASTEVFLVTKAQLDGQDVTPIMAEQVTLDAPRVARPDKLYVTLNADCTSTVTINALPDQQYQLTMEVFLRPSRSATSVPDVLLTQWVDAVVSGALAKLYMVPGQPFSSPDLAQYYESRTARLTHNARITASYGGVRGGMSVKQRPLA